MVLWFVCRAYCQPGGWSGQPRKRVRLQLSDAGIATARQEAQLLWQLSQESVGILQCFAFRMVPEPVLTLELLLEFAPLGDLCRRLRLCKEAVPDHGLPKAEVVAYTYDVAQGLSFLHGLRPKIFHRDVKPANIMLCYPESSVTRACPRAKLADFGVAKVMESEASTAGTATFIGTPHYLSPEVFSGDTYDERADAWALGCVLYEMMCFCRPFHFAETNVAIMALRISQGHYDRERLSQAMGRYPEGLLQTAEGLLRLELSERLRAIDLVESLGSFGFLDEARAESPLPSCWDPLPIDGAGTSSEVRLDTDSWHGAHVASDSSSTQLLAVLEASESMALDCLVWMGLVGILMLIAQLKSSGRPVNYGEFRPRCLSGSEGLLASTASGKLGGATRAAGSSEPSGSPTAGSPRTKSASDRFPGRNEAKVFANNNSYSGTWLDGRMHGDGLYVWNDGTEYAGEFRNGQIWGQGEKRWPNGRRYSGEWVQDMMWGSGEMTWPSGEKYTGQFCKGLFHGRGTRCLSNGDRYTGEFRYGEQEGDGSFENAKEGWTYDGHWRHGLMWGDGRMTWPNGLLYVGEWMNGAQHGTGRLTWPDGACYQGQFVNGHLEGHGRKTFPDGSWFEGSFKGGEFEGRGTFHYADSTEFEGLWEKSAVLGPGTHRFPDGTSITGDFSGAIGEGTKTWASGCTYRGRLLHNQIHHYGVFKWPDGRCYVGHFRDEAMHGVGTLNWTDDHGACSYKGYFEDNLFHGHGSLEFATGAQYEGDFRLGLYDGKGRFNWPGGSFYQGNWSGGKMHGRGVLCFASTEGAKESFVYVGEFVHGELQGCGAVMLPREDGLMDEYLGEFEMSECQGHGVLTAAQGSCRAAGRFGPDGLVGEKVLPSGEVFLGETSRDGPNGPGCMQMGDECVAGFWRDGKRERWLEDIPADPISNAARVFTDVREDSVASPRRKNDGVMLAMLPSGDAYVGFVEAGQKHGSGMFVYRDGSAFKGHWLQDSLDGVEHPRKAPTSEAEASGAGGEAVEEQQPELDEGPAAE
ncbi:Phosphatidylinositol 4-phosphate 5-kinase 5 (AtPIP5K5) (1-phosphatidylinositol 4-phosphate kinase 5) (Diphosphoinositide kinase 5) (PtdIns(4)P-5-kinase 5) [Durusdinium trenchii]|uniref:Phosphatidylinositol 4-phosphate 5-kinase 5 (AtPIP5K5) (1-phosphatidylinositol 4-phosphate kinase 5) (Diphosphoinositide kinase 5) (PtdIns(4)P-5-kinase 5) n=1 Tax=Durusdinium trenchii TaxID=1381693 RepID=A0ABP0LGS1_9DINO